MSKISQTKEAKTTTSSKDEFVVPKAYVLAWEDKRFTFKNFYIEYGRFHMDEV